MVQDAADVPLYLSESNDDSQNLKNPSGYSQAGLDGAGGSGKRWLEGSTFSSRYAKFMNFFQTNSLEHDGPPSWDPVEGKRRSLDIDEYLATESLKAKRQMKILLLGNSRQVDVLWKQAWLLQSSLSEKERADLRIVARQETLCQAKQYIGAILDQIHEKQELVSANPVFERVLQTLIDNEHQPKEAAGMFLELYNDADFRHMLQTRGVDLDVVERKVLEPLNCPLLTCDCCTYPIISSNLTRMFAPDYEPSEHDWIHFGTGRFSASMLREAHVERGTHTLQLIDLVRTTERRKWIHCFENTTCVIFVADLAYYDIHSLEGSSENYLTDEMSLFESVANSAWFRKTPILLVLTNVAAFKEKVTVSPLSNDFPDYTGGPDADKAVEFLREEFNKRVKDEKDLYIHLSEVYGAENVVGLVETMERTTIRTVLKAAGVERC